MNKLFELAKLYTRQFPAGNEPYQIVTRILEECGEVAAEVNHFEKSGVKVWECRNCGHLVVGTKAPEVCPVCNHPQAYFEVREENY